jgi:hypothetical protein
MSCLFIVTFISDSTERISDFAVIVYASVSQPVVRGEPVGGYAKIILIMAEKKKS